ncbi:hypothetical protein [Morganella morganii]|uniref:hypothetical protein n=1 Tax=Morganella morganii TaxID=582 RepID=UPI0034D4671A
MKTKPCRTMLDGCAVRIVTPQAKRNKHVPRWVEFLALVIVAAVAVIPTAM